MYYFFKLKDDQTVFSSALQYIASIPHWHEHSELIYVEEGTVMFYIEDDANPVVLEAGAMLYIKSNVMHNPFPDESAPYNVHRFSFLEKSMYPQEKSIIGVSDKAFCIKAVIPEHLRKNTVEMMNFVHTLSSEDGADDAVDSLYAKQFVSFLLGLNTQYRVDDSDEKNPRNVDEHYQRIHNVCIYIEEHLEENIDTAELARISNYSQSHFYRLFKEVVGCPVSEHILRLKIREAHRLLKSGDAKITEVSYRLGFSHPNNFSRTYRRFVGRNPSEDMKK